MGPDRPPTPIPVVLATPGTRPACRSMSRRPVSLRPRPSWVRARPAPAWPHLSDTSVTVCRPGRLPRSLEATRRRRHSRRAGHAFTGASWGRASCRHSARILLVERFALRRVCGEPRASAASSAAARLARPAGSRSSRTRTESCPHRCELRGSQGKAAQAGPAPHQVPGIVPAARRMPLFFKANKTW